MTSLGSGMMKGAAGFGELGLRRQFAQLSCSLDGVYSPPLAGAEPCYRGAFPAWLWRELPKSVDFLGAESPVSAFLLVSVMSCQDKVLQWLLILGKWN